jgi:hypothetical protein
MYTVKFYRKFPLLRILGTFFFSAIKASDILDEILLRDMMPSIGTKCQTGANSYIGQTGSYTFQHYPSPSYWDPTAVGSEPDLFLAEMVNNNTVDPDKSWTIRFGRGGNIYSFRGIYGEAMPPQYHVDGEWIDEVTQSVSVNLAMNGNQDYFVHQAGVYRDDIPHSVHHFFSPSLAKHCSDKECFFASWGQQAHVPTTFMSDTIYYNGYRDCGDGIIEFTTIIHTAGNSPQSYYTDYHNTPWGGTRTSTLRDIFISSPDGSISQKYPVVPWSSDPNTIQLADDSGGFTIFTEQVVVDQDLYNSRPQYQMPVQNGITLQLIVNGNAQKSNFHSDQFQLHCMRLPVIATFATGAGCFTQCNLWLENPDTNAKVVSPAVIHWAWQGNNMYFCMERGSTDSQFNSKFSIGSRIQVSYANVGKPFENNKSLSVIHGREIQLSESRPPSRVRYGVGGSSRRDYTVYTANKRQRIFSGSTHIFTQYLATGRLSEMEAIGNDWVGEVYEDLVDSTDFTGSGTVIRLKLSDASTFGAEIDGVNNCIQGSLICEGRSLPEFNTVPLFYVTCGSSTYVGTNKYYFAPARNNVNEPIRSYLCEVGGIIQEIRPTWKLLGFFNDGACAGLQDSMYDMNFCPTTLSPTLAPTPVTTSAPTSSPTTTPTFVPSSTPSSTPTSVPTSTPTSIPTSVPTSTPTSIPSSVPISAPTSIPTFVPSSAPTSIPTSVPISSPTSVPSSMPTSTLTVTPTSTPSSAPTSTPFESPSLSPTSLPSSSLCDDNESYFSVEIKVDNDAVTDRNKAKLHGMDTSAGEWKQIFHKRNFYDNELFYWDECLDTDLCYRFVIRDNGRDGICCENGEGFFKLEFDGKVENFFAFLNFTCFIICLKLNSFGQFFRNVKVKSFLILSTMGKKALHTWEVAIPRRKMLTLLWQRFTTTFFLMTNLMIVMMR